MREGEGVAVGPLDRLRRHGRIHDEVGEALRIPDEVVGGRVRPLEHRPPDRLILAAMEVEKVPREFAHGFLEVGGVPLDRGRQGVPLGLAVALLGAARRGVFRAGKVVRPGGLVGSQAHEPVAELAGGDAVARVVIGDLLQERVVAFLAPTLVPDDAVARGLDLCVALARVKDLQVLDGVAGLGNHDGLPDHPVEVDQLAPAQQVVDLGLARTVGGREPPESGRLVGRVVVDVRRRVGVQHRRHGIDGRLEGPAFLRAVVRPKRPEARPLGLVVQAEEIYSESLETRVRA